MELNMSLMGFSLEAPQGVEAEVQLEHNWHQVFRYGRRSPSKASRRRPSWLDLLRSAAIPTLPSAFSFVKCPWLGHNSRGRSRSRRPSIAVCQEPGERSRFHSDGSHLAFLGLGFSRDEDPLIYQLPIGILLR